MDPCGSVDGSAVPVFILEVVLEREPVYMCMYSPQLLLVVGIYSMYIYACGRRSITSLETVRVSPRGRGPGPERGMH